MFEINQDHEFYHLTSMIKEGMRASIESGTDTEGQVKFFTQLLIGESLNYYEQYPSRLLACAADCLSILKPIKNTLII